MPVSYRYKVKHKPKSGGFIVQMFSGKKLIQVAHFLTCNAALSFVERREANQM